MYVAVHEPSEAYSHLTLGKRCRGGSTYDSFSTVKSAAAVRRSPRDHSSFDAMLVGLDETRQLGPTDARIHVLPTGDRRKSTVGACNDVLAPNQAGELQEALGHKPGMFDSLCRHIDESPGMISFPLWESAARGRAPIRARAVDSRLQTRKSGLWLGGSA